MSIPIFYAYSIPALDTRYLFLLFPFFSIISSFFIAFLAERIQYIGKILPIILLIVIISSTIFLYERSDFIAEKEAYLISKYLVENAQGINTLYPEGKYIRASEVIKDFPEIPYKDDLGEYTHKMKIFDINEESLIEFINKHKSDDLSHIVIDDNPDRSKALMDVFNNEQNYPYLEKTLDSKEFGWNYYFKIFKIDVNQFKK